MSTSPITKLSKPIPENPVPDTTLAYFSARAQRAAFETVLAEVEKFGITKSDLAKRLKMDAGQLSRLLGSPGNWRIKTHSNLLFAISGAAPTYGVAYPLDKPPRNHAGAAAALDYSSQRTREPRGGDGLKPRIEASAESAMSKPLQAPGSDLQSEAQK